MLINIVIAISLFCSDSTPCKKKLINCVNSKQMNSNGLGQEDDFLWECIIDREKLK